MMEINFGSETTCSQNKIEESVIKQQLSVDVSNCTISTDTNSSILDLGTDSSSVILLNDDPFEGHLYRTETSETKVDIQFLTKVLFESFQQKVHSDFMNSVEIDETTFISKCTTHVRGAKCSMKLDSHFKTVELSGIGCKVWREERFPRITQTLFKQVLQELDSQTEGDSQCEYLSKGDGDFDVQQTEQICDSLIVDKDDVNVAQNCNVPSSGNVAANGNVLTGANVARMDNVEIPTTENTSRATTPTQTDNSQTYDNGVNKSFTAENITQSYMRNIAATVKAVSAPLSDDCPPIPMNNRTISGIVPDQAPAFTSTPIRQDQSMNGGVTSGSIYYIIGKIDRLESGIKTIKNDILHQMESKLNELKTAVVNMIDSVGRNRTYADVSKSTSTSSSSIQAVEQPSTENNCSSFVDEGYEDQSGTGAIGTSQTQLKTPYVPEDNYQQSTNVRGPKNSNATVQQPGQFPNYQTIGHRNGSTPKPVPVRITNRSMQNRPVQPRNGTERTEPIRNVIPPTCNRTLLVGDSLLKDMNTRGMKNGVRICSRRGAMIKHIWDEIAVFDLRSFSNIILCIGGNDASSNTDAEIFEQKYDELIGNIKAANSECTIYICNVVPRGDVDVTTINSSVEKIADLWQLYRVKNIKSTNEIFFGSNGLPLGRYYLADGIHLSKSGTKRLVDAVNRHVEIVEDYHLCVFQKSRNMYHHNRDNGQGHFKNTSKSYRGMNRIPQFNSRRTSQGRLCYACYMPGHYVADCWFAK